MLIDTHSHIYLPDFDNDRDEVVIRAKDAGIQHIILPNVDQDTAIPMWQLEASDPGYFHATMGIHPTSINSNYRNDLEWVKEELQKRRYIAIGEVGIDLYWDKTYRNAQIDAFEQQLQLAIEYDIPVIIHQRNAFEETIACVEKYNCDKLRGVFHSFGDSTEQAHRILSLGNFYLGINGVVTFKNSTLGQTLQQLSPSHLILETDAPYLTPVPHRGKRNESAYISLVAEKLSSIFELPINEIITITSNNSRSLFGLQ